MNRLFILMLFIFFTNACQVDDVHVKQPPFFDLTDFFDIETTRLSNINEIKKTVTLNNQKEEKTLKNSEVKNDLEIFANSNINKVAWLDKYIVDSIFNPTGILEEIKYKAIDEKLITRELIVKFNAKEVQSIHITNSSSSFVASSKQHLVYTPNKGYLIENTQEVSLSQPRQTKIEVNYIH